MAGYRVPGSLGGTRCEPIDAGTLCVARSASPGPLASKADDHAAFESAIKALEAELSNAGAHLTIDAAARQAYARTIRAMADDLRARAKAGQLTWAEAAEQANSARNVVMDLIRGRSTPVGRAMAQQLKSTGKTLNELIARKVAQLFGPEARFFSLSPAQQNAVYAEIVEAAGRSNPAVTATMRRLSRAGRGLIIVSIGLSIYTIANADDKVGAVEREVSVTAGSVAGGIVGGALAGLACGPGAPVCVTVGAFVGGALAAFGVDMLS